MVLVDWVYNILDYAEKKRTGISWGGLEIQAQLGFTPDKGNQYQAAGDYLDKVLKKFIISEKDAVIDCGCGKGRAMWILAKAGFGCVDGYDISQKLIGEANLNFKQLGVSSICKAFAADAVLYHDYDKDTYIYV